MVNGKGYEEAIGFAKFIFLRLQRLIDFTFTKNLSLFLLANLPVTHGRF